MLNFQTVQAGFRFGVEEGTDPKQVPFGTLLVAENVVWNKTGRLEKRQGTTRSARTTTAAGTITAGKRLMTRGDELCLIDGSNLYSLTDSGWADRGRVPEVGIETSVAQNSTKGVEFYDIAKLANGNLVHAWVNSSGSIASELWCQITDPDTSTTITVPFRVAAIANTGRQIRIVVSGSDWAVIWMDGVNLKAYTSFSGVTTTLRTDGDTTWKALDAIVISNEIVIAYGLGANGIKLVRYSFVSVPILQTNVTVAGEAAECRAVSIDGASGEVIYIGYAISGVIKVAGANANDLSQAIAPITVETSANTEWECIGVVRRSATACLMMYSFYSDVETGGVLKSVSVTSMGTVTTDRRNYFLQLLSRPFLMGSRYYAVACNHVIAGTFQDMPNGITGLDVFLVDATYDPQASTVPSRQVGKVEMLTGGHWINAAVSNVAALSSTTTVLPTPFQASVSVASNQGVIRHGVRLTKLTIGASLPDDMWRSVSIGDEAYLCAGTLFAYDGMELIGYGWAHAPYLDYYSMVDATSGSMAAGNYIYNVTAERRSYAGVLHRSPIATPITITVGASGDVTVAVTPVSLAYSPYNAGLYPVYRTVVSGSIAQRLTLEPAYNVLFNTNFTSQPATMSDTRADADIGGGIALSTRPPLYTEGGELEDFQPPSALTACVYRSRIFAIQGDGHTLMFSKSFADNEGTAGGFNAALRVVFPDRLTALSVLDERLIVFAEAGIFMLAGDGPAPNGDGSDFGSPNKLQSDVGCTNARGVVAGPEGVFFANGNEIHMLTRGLTVEWVGKPVQDLLDSFPNVTSAVLVSKKNHVRFSCQDEAGTAGIVLVFDYVEKQWSHFKYAVSGGNGVAIADACMHGGVYTFLTTDGYVYKESDATSLDNGAWVTAKLETAWIHAAGPIAYQSVRNLRLDGDSATAHGLSISVGFDGNTTYQQGPTSFAEGTTGVTSVGATTAGISIGNRRKCRSIRFKIEDSAPVTPGTGKGGKWSSMGLEVGVKSGVGRLPATQRG